MSGRPSLAVRSSAPELMDMEPASDDDLQACLRDLERVNVASLGYRPTLRWLERTVPPGSRVSLLDVGSGHGDMLRRICRWAERRGVKVDLCGLDASPAATRAARIATPGDLPIGFETGDLFSWRPDRRYDLVVSSLFAHHLDDAGLAGFITFMEREARLGWFVNDLHRHAVPYWGLRLLFGTLPVHRFVRHDGPLSVQRAFRREELLAAVEAAGLSRRDVEIAWHLPFRWGLGRRKVAA